MRVGYPHFESRGGLDAKNFDPNPHFAGWVRWGPDLLIRSSCHVIMMLAHIQVSCNVKNLRLSKCLNVYVTYVADVTFKCLRLIELFITLLDYRNEKHAC